MEKFKKIYMHMLYEQKGNCKISIKEYIKLLQSCAKFNENGLIVENKNLLIDIPEETIIYCLQQQNGNFLNIDIFKNTFKNSKHWNNIKNINFNKIYFKCFNFENISEIDSLHYTFFSIENNEELLELRNAFLTQTNEIYGFYLKYKDQHLLCINKQAKNIEILIYHEISHLIQLTCNIRLIKNEISKKNINKLTPILGAELNQCLEYFSEKEFIPTLNDLLVGLQNVKNKFYRHLSGIEFIFTIKNYLKKIYILKKKENTLFFQYLNVNDNNYYPLSFLITSYILQYKYQYIEDKLLKYFK